MKHNGIENGGYLSKMVFLNRFFDRVIFSWLLSIFNRALSLRNTTHLHKTTQIKKTFLMVNTWARIFVQVTIYRRLRTIWYIVNMDSGSFIYIFKRGFVSLHFKCTFMFCLVLLKSPNNNICFGYNSVWDEKVHSSYFQNGGHCHWKKPQLNL